MTYHAWEPLDTALMDFHSGMENAEVQVSQSPGEPSTLPAWIFFRQFSEFREVEQFALSLCEGKVLDIGAGAGCHSLYLQEDKMEVTAMEIMQNACRIMLDLGIRSVIHADFFKAEPITKFDTLLLMMNGIGIAGTPEGYRRFLRLAREWLNPTGIILFDSSEPDNWPDPNPIYNGIVTYQLSYKQITGPSYDWLYLKSEDAIRIATEEGWHGQILYSGQEGEYLARLWPQNP